MLFAGREVRIGKNCAQGLEYGPRPIRTDLGRQITCLLFFSLKNYFIRNIFVDFFTAAVSHRARAFDVSVK